MKRKLLFILFLCITYSFYAAKTIHETTDKNIRILENVPPTITQQPEDVNIPVSGTAIITVAADNLDTVQWEFSPDNGSSWFTANDGGSFSGSTTTSLSFTIDVAIPAGYLFRAVLTSPDGDSVTSDTALVIVSNYTQIPDPNFEARLEALGYDDISGDGQVPRSLIEGLTSLDVDAQNISDLTGIEDFVALGELRADDNNITFLDVSNNTSLTRLFLRNNSISTLDLTANTGMRRLLVENNGMISLDITGLASLGQLFAAGNNLTEMDLSTNPSLNIIGLGSNNLTRLDVRNGTNTNVNTFQASNNPNLTCIEVDDAAYSTANWTNIDAQTSFTESDCYTQIPDANFEAALDALGYDDISGDGQVPTLNINTLTSLSIGSAGISDLTGIEAFTALETLLANNNTISTADLSNNANLLTVSLRNNGLTSIDVSGSPNMDVILVENNNLTSIDVSNNTLLTRLWAQNNNLNALDVSNNTMLTAIGATSSNLTSLDVSNIPTLEQLYVGGNNLTELDLSNNPVLRIIGVNSNNLSSLNVKNGNNTNVTTFTAAGNPNLTCILVDDVAYSTANWTNIDAQTGFVDTSCYTQIPDANFEATLEALGYDDISGDGQVPTLNINSVTNLNVESDNITDLTGIEAFSALTSLNCSRNDLTSLNVTQNVLLETLVADRTDFTSLDLSNNLALKDLEVDNSLMESIDVSANVLLERLTCHNTSISTIDITNNPNLKEINISNLGLTEIDFTNNLLLEDFKMTGSSPITSLDFSNHPQLIRLWVQNIDLTSLNLRNGNNGIFFDIRIQDNPNLACVLVDDVAFATANITNVDATTSFSSTYCVYTSIPDSSFESRLEALGYDDISEDGQVPTALIEGVTTLDVGGQGISDMTGIEAFTALISLRADDNPFTSIDLSSNTALLSLNLDSTSLTSIDLTNNTALISLDLEDTQTLTSLDLSTNILLQDADLADTGISSITFGNNTSLVNLNLANNELEFLDLSSLTGLLQVYIQNNNLLYVNIQNGNNTAINDFRADRNSGLVCVLVDDAAYSNANWTQIDAATSFSNTDCYTAIPDANFEAALDALGYDDITGDGQVLTALIAPVTSLNVQTQNIADLTGIEDFKALTELRMATNPVTSLDLTNNTLLQLVDAPNCDLVTVDVTGLTQLTDLYLNLNDLVTFDASTLSSLDHLAIASNDLTSLDLRNGNNAAISVLDVRSNDELTCVQVDDLAFITSPTIYYDSQTQFSTTEYCRYTSIPDTNFEAVLDTLGLDDTLGDGRVPTSLIETVTTLDLNARNIADVTGLEDFAALTEVILGGNNLTSIDISSNTLLERIEIENMSTFNTNLDVSANTALTEIVLNSTNCPRVTFGANTNLTTIDINNNEINNIDLSSLTGLVNVSLRSNSLTKIDLRNGANTNIVNFNTTDNLLLTCISVDDVAYSIANWTNIDAQTLFSTLDCRYTQIPDASFEAILEAEGYDDISGDGQVPTSLIEVVETLQLEDSNNVVSDLTGIEDFAALRFVYAGGNNITTVDFSSNPNLEVVEFRDSPINAIDLTGNSQLTSLELNAATLANIDLTENELLQILDVNNSAFTSLNLSANEQLQQLYADNNNLTTITFGNNTQLRQLFIRNNALVTLDLSPFTALEDVFLSNNALTDLIIKSGNNTNILAFDATNNPNLTCIFVDDAVYSTTNWTAIDAQMIFRDGDYCEYTAIPDPNFEIAIFNEGLDDVLGDAQVPTTLIASVTNFNAIGDDINDLTGIEDFTDLRSLNLRGNNLTTVDFTANTALIFLNLSANTISNINLTGLTALRDLNLEDNNLTAIDLSTNINLDDLYLSSNANLTSLDVTNNTDLNRVEANQCTNLTTITFGNNIFISVFQALQSGLTSLDISSLVRLRQLILNDSSLQSLDISSNTLLRDIYLENTPISYLDMRNGNNTDLDDVFLSNNANLFCILVDDAAYSTTNWTNRDAQVTFSDTYCLYTAIPDSNFEARLDALGYDDISGDGQVPTLLIEGVTSLNIASQNISDLTGIEAFAALEVLTANNNTITSADFSNNPNLRVVDLKENALASINVTSNTNLESLDLNNAVFSSIDVSVNTALTSLYITNNTNLTTVDVSANTALTQLSLNGNALTSITLGNLTALQEFYVENNAIESLDLSALTGLNQVNVGNNNLSSLDLRNGNNIAISSMIATGNPNLLCISASNVSYANMTWFSIDPQTSFSSNDYCNYTAIPDSDFEAALENLGYDDISGDGQVPTVLIEVVTSLDISYGIAAINDLTGIEAFTALEELYIGGNSISTLDLTSNINLIKLDCEANGISSIDLTGLTELTELDASFNSYATLDLSTNTKLTKLHCKDAGLNTSLDVSMLPLLTDLDCSFNFLTALNVRNGNNTNFTNFDATNNPNLTCIFVDDAAYSTTNWPNIDAIASFTATDYCRYTAIPDPNFEVILGNLGYDDIASDGQVPTELIEVVTSLDLSLLNVSDITGILDFAALQSLNISNTNVTSLNLSGMANLETLNIASTGALNSLDVSSATALKTIIANDSNVSSIDLTDATALEEVYLFRTQITALDVSTNMALQRLEAYDSPLASINFNGVNTIEVLSIYNTDITTVDTSGLTALVEFQAYNNPLFTGDLDLSANTNLQIVNISNTGLSYFDFRNGNNTNITVFDATLNPSLTCILVDDATYSTTNWTNIDATTNFSDTFCRYTAIPDANFEAALDDAGYDDITGDGQVPTVLIEVVTSLNVSGEDIADLTGIEDFTALTFLNVGGNQIVNLDLSSNVFLEEFNGFRGTLEMVNTSNCVNLRVFAAAQNAITVLDLSDNSALEELSLTDNNLSSLTVINNTNLIELDASRNPIGAIDVSANTLLERIALGSCGLTSLDVSNNVNLKDLSLGTNDIATIDLSNNPLLESVFLANNVLTAIDFSNNLLLDDISLRDNNLTTVVIPDLPNLTDLLIDENPNLASLTLGALPVLDELNASECALTTLDISTLPAIVRLNLADNQLTSLDVSSNTALNRVYVQNNNLNFLNVRNGNNTNFLDFDALNNPNLTCILVDDAAYSTANWTAIDATASFTSTDYCRYTAIPDSVFETMLGNLGYDDIASDGQVPTELIENVTNLDVSYLFSPINDLTGIEAFTALEELNVLGNSINVLDLTSNINLRILNCEANGVSTLNLTGLTELEELNTGSNLLNSLDVSTNTKLTKLHCQDAGLNTSLDVSMLPLLTDFDCSLNFISSLNVQNGNNVNFTFFDARNNPNLTCIQVDDAAYSTANWTNIDPTASFTSTDYCRYTAIPDANFEAALDALGMDDITGDGQVPTALIETRLALEIDNNNINDLTGIEDFTALLTLNIVGNNITSLNVSNNTALQNLLIAQNDITTLDLSANTALSLLIADELPNLAALDLSNNPALAIFSAKLSSNLQTITFGNNTNLAFVELEDTAVSALDVSSLTSLRYIGVTRTNLTSIDLSSNTALEVFLAQESTLETIDIRNGSNTIITQFNTLNSPNLTCISVDDVAYSTTNWTNVDAIVNFSNTGYCRYTTIPDSVFEMRLEAIGLDDISGDGQVPTELIEVVTTLDASFLFNAITDLTGIQDFTALEDLNVTGNDLTTLDLTANTNLRVVYCDANELTSVNLTGLTELEELNVGDNPFTSLDLSTNTKLTRLSIYDSNLSALDVSHLTFLTVLDCAFSSFSALNVRNGNNTNFTFFDASFNPNLTCILVDDAVYSTANWTNIDATASFTSTDYCRYTQIPDANFEAALDALGYDDIPGDGQVPTELIEVLTELNVASNNISDMTGIEDFTALEIFYPFNNNLTSLDVSQNTNLQILLAADNNLTSLDLSNNVALTFLNANNNAISAIDLSANVNLLSLRINNNALTSLDVSANPSLARVTCEDNQITSLDLSSNSLLSTIQVDGNDLMTLNVQNGNNTNVITFSAQNNPNLTCITVDDVVYSDISWTDIDPQSFFSTADCRYTAIPDANFEARLEALGYDDISGDGQVPTALIEVIPTLNVSNQSITDLTGIQDFTALQVLNIENNSITDLDISGMPNLLSLDAENAITSSLDASNTPLLEEVNVQESTIATINLTNATSLNILLVFRTNISTLDLSTNNSIATLIAFEMPNLTSVDLTGAVLLSNLEIYQTPLETLDLTSNISLQFVTVFQNNLTSLNIQNGSNTNITSFFATDNPNLTCILVDDVAYSTTNWTNIDATASFSDTYCRYTQIPDSQFELYLENVGLDDISGDGQVPTALIEVITGLSMSGFSVADLTGIEDFVALNNLTIIDANLTNVDLTQNTLLTRLSLTNSGVTSLDISTCTALDFLSISGSSMTSLDLSNNLLLNYLAFSDDTITELDLSQNTALTISLFGDLPNLTSLDLQNGNNTNITQFSISSAPNLDCVLVDDAAYSTANWTAAPSNISYNEVSCDNIFDINIKVYLQGAALNPNTGEENLMRDDLRVGGFISTRSPYEDMISCPIEVFDVAGNDAIVDWVWVELREASSNTTVAYSRSALLQRDGDVVDVDGVSPLNFTTEENSYRIAVKHRNHLGIITNSAITFGADNTIDFTSSATGVYGLNSRTTSGMPTDIMGLWCGNVNGDIVVQYSGTSPDTPDILSEVLNDPGNFLNFPTYSVTGYTTNDVNMDGMIQYSGTNPDTPFILQNVLAHPGNFLNFSTYQIIEQLPENLIN